MRKINRSTIMFITLSIIGAIFILTPPTYAAPHRSFSDVQESYWAANQILTLANYDIINGSVDGRFRPKDGLRRSEMAKLLSGAFVLPQSAKGLGFTDISADHWAANSVSTCVTMNIVSGFPDGTFRPDKMATRAQLAKTLVMIKGYSPPAPGAKAFNDVKTTYWAYEYIEAAARDHLVSGYPDGTFKPEAQVTRAEAAALIYRALKNDDYLIASSTVNNITYERYRRFIESGPININVLTIPKTAPLSIKPALSQNTVAGREKLSSMAKNKGAAAGINADFFSLKSGECTGLMVDGQIIASPASKRSFLGILPDNTCFIDRVSMSSTVTTSTVGGVAFIAAINKSRDLLTNSIVAYTPFYGISTLTNNKGTEVIMRVDSGVFKPNSEFMGVVTDVRRNLGNSFIPSDSIVLSGVGVGATYLSGLVTGDVVQVKVNFGPRWQDGASAIGGGPRLIRDGKVYVESEGFNPSVVSSRHPRTGIGIDPQGNLIVEVIDGRHENFSIGMSLSELANELKKRGAINAMNFDGGGSSSLFFNGIIRNYPPNSGGSERAISNAILFLPH